MTKQHTLGTGRHPHLGLRVDAGREQLILRDHFFVVKRIGGGIGIARDAPQEMAKVTWLKK